MSDPFKGLEKILPVHVIPENILPAVPTAHDVINRPRIFHSQLARHAGKTTGSIPIASRPWFDPFLNKTILLPNTSSARKTFDLPELFAPMSKFIFRRKSRKT
jgi:hypothetical protein